MRCMVIVKATEDSENGVMPSEKDLSEMGSFNEELVDAGVMVDGAGLHPTAKGVRLTYTDGNATVANGPFTESTDLIAGYWVWEVDSIEEAIGWARRIPFNHGEAVEIRPFFEADDFGEEYTPELREKEQELEAKIREQQGS